MTVKEALRLLRRRTPRSSTSSTSSTRSGPRPCPSSADPPPRSPAAKPQRVKLRPRSRHRALHLVRARRGPAAGTAGAIACSCTLLLSSTSPPPGSPLRRRSKDLAGLSANSSKAAAPSSSSSTTLDVIKSARLGPSTWVLSEAFRRGRSRRLEISEEIAANPCSTGHYLACPLPRPRALCPATHAQNGQQMLLSLLSRSPETSSRDASYPSPAANT